MARMWWHSQRDFERDLRSASAVRVREMREWAKQHEQSANQPGMGRSPKARRHFRLMRVAAEDELARRGDLGPA